MHLLTCVALRRRFPKLPSCKTFVMTHFAITSQQNATVSLRKHPFSLSPSVPSHPGILKAQKARLANYQKRRRYKMKLNHFYWRTIWIIFYYSFSIAWWKYILQDYCNADGCVMDRIPTESIFLIVMLIKIQRKLGSPAWLHTCEIITVNSPWRSGRAALDEAPARRAP